MKLNLDAIKNKIATLHGENRTQNSSNVQLWKPDVGEYVIRAMHWPAHLKLTNEGEPFVERWFYYNIARRGILAPYQFGKEDPIHDLRLELFRTKKPEDKLIAKKLFPRMRCYTPIVVKKGDNADPDQTLVWSFGSTVYEKLLSYFVKEDIGDYLDPKEGFDLDIKISKKGGNQYYNTDIDLARRPSPLAESDEKIKALMDSIPDIRELWAEKTTAQVKADLDTWLNGGMDDSEGTEKSQSDKATALDNLVNEVTAKEPEKKKPKKATTSSKKSVEVDVDDAGEGSSEPVDLDSAFDELMADA